MKLKPFLHNVCIESSVSVAVSLVEDKKVQSKLLLLSVSHTYTLTNV